MEETEQASEPDTAEMLELSDWAFKITMVNNYAKGSWGKSGHCARAGGEWKQRAGDSKTECEGSARNKKKIMQTAIKNAFGALSQRPDSVEKIVSLKICY